MAKTPNLSDVTNILNSTTILNNNWDEIQTSFENTLSRDGSTPNQMEADIDLNSNDLLNVNNITVDGTFQYQGSPIETLLDDIMVGDPSNVYTSTETYSGDGLTTTFTLPFDPISVNNTLVYINGVYQQKNNYSLFGTSLIFSTAPPFGSNNVEVVLHQSVEGVTGPPGPAGADGADGVDGVNGTDGEDGVGVPIGGTTGQVLKKASNTDYDTVWLDEAGGSSVNPAPDDYADNTTPGVTDMTAAFQSALNVGGSVTLRPNTTYAVSSLSVVSGNRIDLNGSTVFQLASSVGAVFDMNGVDDVYIFNGTVDGNKSNQSNDGNFGVKAGTTTSNRVRINEVYFKDCYSGSLKMNECDDLMVTGCSFRNGGAASASSRNEVGIGLSANVSVTDNNFYGSLLTGADNVALIVDTSGGKVVIKGNHFENYESEVLQVVRYNAGAEDTGANRIDKTIISNNIINGSSGAAPYCINIGDNCQNIIVTGNICFDAITGIQVGRWVRDIVVSDNICRDNSGSGITILGKAYGSIKVSGNLCKSNGTSGINYTAGVGDSVEALLITGNICVDNCQVTAGNNGGIRLDGDVSSGNIVGNLCTDNQAIKTQEYGLSLAGGTYTDLTISNNNVAGNVNNSSYLGVSRDSFVAINNYEDTPSIDDSEVAANGNLTVRNYLEVAGGMEAGGYATFNGNVDHVDNNILRVKRITLTPQSADPGGLTGSLAVSDGTSSTNNFGAGGAGIYERTSGGLWVKR